jgi:hypothetical protein
MDLWATNMGNAYLEAYTSEKLVIVGGAKFREMEGHILIISIDTGASPSVVMRWDLHHQKLNPTFGCDAMATTMSI